MYPLRLAEEYRAYFGQAALNDLIRKEIHDTAWQPGALHQSLLDLPWSEVMTTNWDTLLERSAQTIHTRIYGLVSKQSETHQKLLAMLSEAQDDALPEVRFDARA